MLVIPALGRQRQEGWHKFETGLEPHSESEDSPGYMVRDSLSNKNRKERRQGEREGGRERRILMPAGL